MIRAQVNKTAREELEAGLKAAQQIKWYRVVSKSSISHHKGTVPQK